MNRFFENISGNPAEIVLSPTNAHHAERVLRLKKGENAVVCDGLKNDFLCEISHINDGVRLNVLSKSANAAEPNDKLIIFQSLPKADKMEHIIQKCVELGVWQIVPVVTERCVAKIDKRDGPKKVERWNKIAASAACQSGRGIMPAVTRVYAIEELFSSDIAANCDTMCVAYEKPECCQTMKQWLKNGANVGACGFFVGPEGGFSDNEIQFFRNKGVAPITLGPRVLRTETAAPTICACYFYEREQ